MMSRRRAQPEDTTPTPDGTVCRCGLDLIPLVDVAARLDVSKKTAMRWHRLYGLPLFQLAGVGYFASWRAIEQWAQERATARSQEHVELESFIESPSAISRTAERVTL